jgi:hypothetical protein
MTLLETLKSLEAQVGMQCDKSRGPAVIVNGLQSISKWASTGEIDP